MSVVQQPLEALGETAAGLLFSQMRLLAAGELEDSDGEPLMLQPRLVLRESCGCRPEPTA